MTTLHTIDSDPMTFDGLAAGLLIYIVENKFPEAVKVGDWILFRRWDFFSKEFTGENLSRTVAAVIDDARGLESGFVILHLSRILPAALYIGDNGRAFCGSHATPHVRASGCDTSGRAVVEVEPEEIELAARLAVPLVCPYCEPAAD